MSHPSRLAVHAQRLQAAIWPIASWRSGCCGWAVRSFWKVSGSRSSTSQQLPDTDFRIHTLDLVGVSMGAWGLRGDFLRWPALPELKALYLNGRLWFGQPNTLVADTIALFNGSPNLEKFVLGDPVQAYIPMEDTVVEADGYARARGDAAAPDAPAG